MRDAVALLALLAVLVALASVGCVRRVEVEVPGTPVPCLAEAPPAAAQGLSRVACAPDLVCYRAEDFARISTEVEARRGWDDRAWARCRAP